MKVVLDANILISFLLTHSETISKIIDGWERQKFTILATYEIITEVKQVIERFVAAKLIKENEALALMDRLEGESLIVPSLSTLTVSPDKKDNRYLECAKDGNADYLVTGAKKPLLRFGKFGKTKIISPTQFVRVLQNSD